jgi:Conjugal transfer protein
VIINRDNLRDALIAAVISSAITLYLNACASQPPPQPPVVVQATPTPTPIPPDPYATLPTDEAEAIKHNQTPILQHNGTVVYPYSPDFHYTLNCKPLHVVMIRLQDNETTTKDNVKVGDVTRWNTIVGDHTVLVFPLDSPTPITVPGSQVTVPAAPNLITNLAIHSTLHLPDGSTTSGLDYIFDPVEIAKSGKPFTEKVEFYYPQLVRAQAAARETALKQQGQQEATR